MASRDLVPISAKALRKAMLESAGCNTQVRLAEKSGLYQTVLSRILLGGQRRIVRDTLGALARALNVSPDLLGIDPDNPDPVVVRPDKPVPLSKKVRSVRKGVKKKEPRMKYLAPAIVADERLVEVFPIIRQYAQQLGYVGDFPLEKVEANLRPSKNGKGLGVVLLRLTAGGKTTETEFKIQWLRKKGLVPLGTEITE